MSLDVINLSSNLYYKIYLNSLRGACMKKITIILVISFFSLITFAQDKHFERNQLPQLSQEILDSSDFKSSIKKDNTPELSSINNIVFLLGSSSGISRCSFK